MVWGGDHVNMMCHVHICKGPRQHRGILFLVHNNYYHLFLINYASNTFHIRNTTSQSKSSLQYALWPRAVRKNDLRKSRGHGFGPSRTITMTNPFFVFPTALGHVYLTCPFLSFLVLGGPPCLLFINHPWESIAHGRNQCLTLRDGPAGYSIIKVRYTCINKQGEPATKLH